MTTDTVFDLASLTKSIATATCVMKLVEDGHLDVDDAVAKHIPEFADEGKEKITIKQLLTHQGGLIADNALSDYADGPDEAMRRIFALKPHVEPGTRFVYSDVGFIVLGEVVARVAYSSNRGDLCTKRAFGHSGFTGTSIWIDPGWDLYVIFLSNRVHPDGKGSVNPLAGRIGTIAAAAIR